MFSGAIVIILAVILSLSKKENISLKVAVNLLFVSGIIFLWLSSVPFFLKSEWLMLLLVFIFLVMFHFRNRMQEKFLYIVRCLILFLALFYIIFEIPYFLCPEIPDKNYKKMYLIGDSISGGVGFKGEKTWHERMAEKHNIEIKSYSVGGAKVSTMFNSAARIQDEDALILLEIGGNDILRRTALKQYESDLEKLLQIVCKPGRTVVMFGLPAPPFFPEIVSIQRSLSEKYGVILIPRRYFSSMLAGNENSVDGLHLSNSGHERMANMIWELLKPLFKEEK